MNRFLRRLARFGTSRGRRLEDAAIEQQERALADPRTPQDVTSVRAKSSGHGKKTADKWNQ
ncbi:MAG: hypothetical protein R3C15_18710 [Thermoleophilia bacterium]